MTPDDALSLAQYQRPGVRIVVGATSAKELPVTPLGSLHHLPGDNSWRERDLRLRLGFVPSLWAMAFANSVEAAGGIVTDDEWRWLHGPATLGAARAWLEAKIIEHFGDPAGI
jgi:hypothetical protein